MVKRPNTMIARVIARRQRQQRIMAIKALSLIVGFLAIFIIAMSIASQ